MKEVTLKQVGWYVSGLARIKCWGGGEGEVVIIPTRIVGTLTKRKLLEAVNDGQFGCQAILSIDLDVEELYEEDLKLNPRLVSLNQARCQEGLRGI